MLDIDHYSTTEVFVGIKYDINISTLLSQASGWYAVDPPNSTAYFGVELTVHSGTTFVEKDTGDPGYWLDDFSTHASIGNEPANLHSYVNTNDQNDWVGATDQLDRYRSYDVSDMVGSTATWLLGEVPYLGTAISTGEYLDSMHNMLTNDPETGTSVEFSYSPDSVARFSPWVRVALDQMDRAQTVSVDVTEGGSPGTWGTSTSLTFKAPDEDPNVYRETTTSELNSKNIKQTTIGEIRRNPSKYTIAPRSHLPDETAIYLNI